MLLIDSSGNVYRNTPGGSTWSIDGTTETIGAIKQNPIFYFDDVIIPSHDGTDAVKRASETQVTDYTYTTSYHPVYLTQWKQRMVGAVNENIVFGPPGDPNQAWDDTAVYVQTQPIRGLATVRSATLIFYDGFTDILRGTTPAGYGVTSGDVRFDTLFPNAGIVSAFSICYWGEQVCWADRQGVYRSDGASLIDITERAGVRDMWRQIFIDHETAVGSGYIRVAAGIFSDLLTISITNTNTNAFIDAWQFDLPKGIGWRISNLNVTTFMQSPIEPYELWGGWQGSVGRVIELSHFIDTDTSVDEDGLDTPVEPVVEFPYHRFANGNQRIVDLYLGYVLEGTPGDTDLLVEFTKSVHPLSTSYSSYDDGDEILGPVDIHGDTDEEYHYRKIPVRLESPGIGVRVTQRGASDATRIYNLSASVLPRQGWEQT
jgi:hypothetical protein